MATKTKQQVEDKVEYKVSYIMASKPPKYGRCINH